MTDSLRLLLVSHYGSIKSSSHVSHMLLYDCAAIVLTRVRIHNNDDDDIMVKFIITR